MGKVGIEEEFSWNELLFNIINLIMQICSPAYNFVGNYGNNINLIIGKFVNGIHSLCPKNSGQYKCIHCECEAKPALISCIMVMGKTNWGWFCYLPKQN